MPEEGRLRVLGRPRLLAAGAGAVAIGAGWLAQHRLVARGRGNGPAVDEDLALADDVVHHEIDTDDGGTIHVVERGRGTPLLLLHGITLSSLTWVHQLNDLAGRFRVIAVDQRGHGRSEPGRDGFGMGSGANKHLTETGIERLARDLGTVLEALDLRGAVLVGHSMGGMVCLQYATTAPPGALERRVAGLVLTSTTAGPFTTVPGLGRVLGVAGPFSSRTMLLAERVGVRAMPGRDFPWWAARIAFGPAPASAQVHFVEAMTRAVPVATLAGLLVSVGSFDVSSDLERVQVPVLVVVGSHDHLTPPRHARALAAILPRAELVELPRCGHMPMLERRFEFSRLVTEFAEKVSLA